jgi:hypothetical protein
MSNLLNIDGTTKLAKGQPLGYSTAGARSLIPYDGATVVKLYA